MAKGVDITTKSLCDWIKKYSDLGSQYQTISDQQAKVTRLKAELRRVTEERDILKEAAAYFVGESRKSTRSYWLVVDCHAGTAKHQLTSFYSGRSFTSLE